MKKIFLLSLFCPIISFGQTNNQIAVSFPIGKAPITRQAASYCCKQCDKGKACGNSCISRSKVCHKPPGCACDK